MPSSKDIYSQINSTMGELNPLVSAQPGASDFFKQGLNKAFDYGMPLLKEGAGLEAGAYALPQTLMQQYAGEFGPGFGGPGAANRLGSILNRLGTQFGLVDVANKLSERQGSRIEDIAGNLTNQYGMKIQGLKDKVSMLQPMFNTAVGREDAASARAAQAAAARRNEEANKLMFQKLNDQMLGGGAPTGIISNNPTAGSGQVVNPKYSMMSVNPSKLPSDYYLPKPAGPMPMTTPSLTSQYKR